VTTALIKLNGIFVEHVQVLQWTAPIYCVIKTAGINEQWYAVGTICTVLVTAEMSTIHSTICTCSSKHSIQIYERLSHYSFISTRPTCQMSFTEFQRILKKDTSLHYIFHSQFKWMCFYSIQCGLLSCYSRTSTRPIYRIFFTEFQRILKIPILSQILHSHHKWIWQHTCN
jgi:hypothetical protein